MNDPDPRQWPSEAEFVVLGAALTEVGDKGDVYLEPTGRFGATAARIVVGPMRDVVKSVMEQMKDSMRDRKYSVDFTFEVGLDKPFRLLGKITVHVEPAP